MLYSSSALHGNAMKTTNNALHVICGRDLCVVSLAEYPRLRNQSHALQDQRERARCWVHVRDNTVWKASYRLLLEDPDRSELALCYKYRGNMIEIQSEAGFLTFLRLHDSGALKRSVNSMIVSSKSFSASASGRASNSNGAADGYYYYDENDWPEEVEG